MFDMATGGQHVSRYITSTTKGSFGDLKLLANTIACLDVILTVKLRESLTASVQTT